MSVLKNSYGGYKDWVGLTIVTLVVVLFFVGLLGASWLIGRAECNRISSDSGIRTNYRIPGGCYVEVNGRMIPRENWRGEYEQ